MIEGSSICSQYSEWSELISNFSNSLTVECVVDSFRIDPSFCVYSMDKLLFKDAKMCVRSLLLYRKCNSGFLS